MDIFADKLVKICQKQEHVNDILNGKIYMNELGSFNSALDTFRGDKYDGYRIQEGEMTARLEWRGEFMAFPLTRLPMSFVGANKIPIFSAVQLDESLFGKVSENKYRFRDTIISHMEQFGQYAVWLNKTELMTKIEEYANENNVKIHCGNIRYIDAKNSLPKFYTWEEQIREFIFVKTTSDERNYQYQNEWRMAITYPQVIPSDKNHIIIDIGKLEYALQIPSFEWLKDGVLNVEYTEVSE